MKRNITLVLLATLMIASITAYQVETDISKTNVIVTTGNAEIRVKPDIATIFVYLTAQGKTASQATNNASADVDKIISNLQGLVNKNDIGTSFFSIYPKYDFSSGSPVIVGYTVYQSLTITIRGITNNNNKISRVIDAITKGGAPLTISGITYSNQDQEKGKAEARAKAYNQAKNAAMEYARLAGRRLGKILKIDQTTPAYALPFAFNTAPGVPVVASGSIPLADVAVRVATVIVWQLI